MCDLCGDPADHDKPYEIGRVDLMELRLTLPELRSLALLRKHILDVRHGYSEGPAAGDVPVDLDGPDYRPNDYEPAS